MTNHKRHLASTVCLGNHVRVSHLTRCKLTQRQSQLYGGTCENISWKIHNTAWVNGDPCRPSGQSRVQGPSLSHVTSAAAWAPDAPPPLPGSWRHAMQLPGTRELACHYYICVRTFHQFRAYHGWQKTCPLGKSIMVGRCYFGQCSLELSFVHSEFVKCQGWKPDLRRHVL